MSKTALSFHKFATAKAQAGNFADTADVRTHYSEMQYHSWINSTLIEYRDYLTLNFPTMTLAQAAELTAQEPQNV